MSCIEELNELRATAAEAQRFINKAAELEKVLMPYAQNNTSFAPGSSAERASCKRASMDLTRSLAKFRSRK